MLCDCEGVHGNASVSGYDHLGWVNKVCFRINVSICMFTMFGWACVCIPAWCACESVCVCLIVRAGVCVSIVIYGYVT